MVMLGMLALTAAPVAAEEPARLSLPWSAPPGCPGGSAVRQRTESLLGGGPVEPRLSRSLSARGKVTSSSGRFELRLSTLDNGLAGERSIQGASCEELASAGALIIALAIDPQAVAEHSAAATTAAAEASTTGGEAAVGEAPPPPPPEATTRPPPPPPTTPPR